MTPLSALIVAVGVGLLFIALVLVCVFAVPRLVRVQHHHHHAASPSGATGPAGDTGTEGGPGPFGATGPMGVPGSATNTGAVGPTGAQGMQGAQGRQGISGATGPAGQFVPNFIQAYDVSSQTITAGGAHVSFPSTLTTSGGITNGATLFTIPGTAGNYSIIWVVNLQGTSSQIVNTWAQLNGSGENPVPSASTQLTAGIDGTLAGSTILAVPASGVISIFLSATGAQGVTSATLSITQIS